MGWALKGFAVWVKFPFAVIAEVRFDRPLYRGSFGMIRVQSWLGTTDRLVDMDGMVAMCDCSCYTENQHESNSYIGNWWKGFPYHAERAKKNRHHAALEVSTPPPAFVSRGL